VVEILAFLELEKTIWFWFGHYVPQQWGFCNAAPTVLNSRGWDNDKFLSYETMHEEWVYDKFM
jgi:hypothetical protein